MFALMKRVNTEDERRLNVFTYQPGQGYSLD
jgi:hypothetical protein